MSNLTDYQRSVVERARASVHGGRAPWVAARWPRQTRAKDAAQFAHDHHVTRAKAAQLFDVALADVVEAWEQLFPTTKRVRT